MNMIQYELTRNEALRKWLMLALIVLAFLTIVAISYFTLSALWPTAHLHVFADTGPNPTIVNPYP